MTPIIVRNPRTCQPFAKSETTFDPVDGSIGPMGEGLTQIANRLIRTRLALGYENQVDFCREIGVEKNLYNPFEKAKRRISLQVALKIRQRFEGNGMTLDWIYCGDATQLSSKLLKDISRAA